MLQIEVRKTAGILDVFQGFPNEKLRQKIRRFVGKEFLEVPDSKSQMALLSFSCNHYIFQVNANVFEILVLTKHEYMGPNLTQAEGFVLGVGAKMFTLAGPVIVYGVSASVNGLVYWITILF